MGQIERVHIFWDILPPFPSSHFFSDGRTSTLRESDYLGLRHCVLRSPLTMLIREPICHLREQRLEPRHSCTWEVQMMREMLSAEFKVTQLAATTDPLPFLQDFQPAYGFASFSKQPRLWAESFQLLPHSLHHPSSLHPSTPPCVNCSLSGCWCFLPYGLIPFACSSWASASTFTVSPTRPVLARCKLLSEMFVLGAVPDASSPIYW